MHGEEFVLLQMCKCQTKSRHENNGFDGTCLMAFRAIDVILLFSVGREYSLLGEHYEMMESLCWQVLPLLSHSLAHPRYLQLSIPNLEEYHFQSAAFILADRSWKCGGWGTEHRGLGLPLASTVLNIVQSCSPDHGSLYKVIVGGGGVSPDGGVYLPNQIYF